MMTNYRIFCLLALGLFLSTPASELPLNFLWSKQATDDSGSSPRLVADRAGNVYVAGSFDFKAVFGSFVFNAVSGDRDIYLVKYSPLGNVLWAKRVGSSSSSDDCTGLAIDSSDNLYITGTFSGTVTFGSTTLTASGTQDIFFAKLNSDGQFQYARKVGGTTAISAGRVDTAPLLSQTFCLKMAMEFGRAGMLARRPALFSKLRARPQRTLARRLAFFPAIISKNLSA